MKAETMLREFLDGDLDQAEQENLFRSLAEDGELRRVLQDHLRMHAIVQQEVPTIAAPAAAAANIFAAVGYGGPAAAAPGWGASALNGLKRFGSHGLAAVAGALLVLLLSAPWSAGDAARDGSGIADAQSNRSAPSGSTSAQSANGALTGSPTGLAAALNNDAAAAEISMDFPLSPAWSQIAEAEVYRPQTDGADRRFATAGGQTASATTTSKNTSKSKASARPQRAAGRNAQAIAAANTAALQQENSGARAARSEDLVNSPRAQASTTLASVLKTTLKERELVNRLNGFAVRGFADEFRSDSELARIDNILPPEFPIQGRQREAGLTIELRTLLANSSPEVGLPSQVDGFTADRSLAFTYELNENLVVGIEGGRESFGQEYRTMLLDRGATVRQNPQLFWAGLVGRYELRELSPVEIVFPYVQVLAGTSEVGPLGKGIFGIRSDPQNSISLSAGVEFSRLWYDINGVQFSSSKFGWFYGASVRF